MKIFEIREGQLRIAFQGQLALLLLIAFLLWVFGAPALLNHAKAANLTSVTDTLSQSGPNQFSKHTVQYQTPSPIAPGQTIKISFDPNSGLGGTGASSFAELFSVASTSDFFLATSSTATNVVATSSYAIVTSCSSGNQATVAGNLNGGTDENYIFTICGTSPTSIATSTFVTVTIGSSTLLVSNPASNGSYRIDALGTQPNSGETQVAIVNNVTLTAAVNTTFTFTVTGLATTTEIGAGDFTTGSTSPTSLPFGVLSSSPNASSSLAQRLNVSTNSSNGFSVTVQENQPPTSATGQLIYLFSNGATTSNPILWTPPTSIIGQNNTYGHFGVTTADDENGNEFLGGTKWAGNINFPRVVFTNNGPADGTTNSVGSTTVGFKIQIGPLQAAANDYTNTLWYVATPTF